jgi:hypothetical protein
MGRISGRYSVDRAILFGSRARRTHTADSDSDIAVVLKGEHGKRSTTAIDMAGIAFDVMLETGILVEALSLSGGEMEHPEQLSNPALIRTTASKGGTVSKTMTPAAYMRKSEQALSSACQLLAAGNADGACNRAHNAMFDAEQAALLAANVGAAANAIKTHRGLISASDQHPVLGEHAAAAFSPIPRVIPSATKTQLGQSGRLIFLSRLSATPLASCRKYHAVKLKRNQSARQSI